MSPFEMAGAATAAPPARTAALSKDLRFMNDDSGDGGYGLLQDP
jgi:hypothetical protein